MEAMQSKIADAARCTHRPVALSFTDEKPERALQFAEGKWGCVMWLHAAATKGRYAVADAKTYGCVGGGVGLGFGNPYKEWPGGIECFYHFLSTGNDQWEQGRQAAEAAKAFLRGDAYDEFVHGERYIKTPELVAKFVEELPMIEAPKRFVVFSPIEEVEESSPPELVIFTVPPDQLAALQSSVRPCRKICYFPPR
jgi:uncharacterized protein (DUF169 family)